MTGMIRIVVDITTPQILSILRILTGMELLMPMMTITAPIHPLLIAIVMALTTAVMTSTQGIGRVETGS